MTRYGLPTYPINDGMYLEKRDDAEIEWLLDHGVLQTDMYRYLKIAKVASDRYQLLKQEDDRYGNSEQLIREAETWQGLGIERIETWRWWGREPEEEN